MNSIEQQRDLEATLITTFDMELAQVFQASGGATEPGPAPAEGLTVPAPPDKPLELFG